MASEKYIKLSIIISTIGRNEELEKLLKSLESISFDFEYEIHIIDQNDNCSIDIIIGKFINTLPIIHHKVKFKGLSKAKNYGVSVANGEYISFPDDDCAIFMDTYQEALECMQSKNLDIVFGKCIDNTGRDSVLSFKKEAYFLNQKNMLGGFVEATVVAKKRIFQEFMFDENMGAGTFFGAEEGFDWLYRILQKSSYRVYYNPKIKFYHPQVILSKGKISALNRVFTYRCGTAYLCVKHSFYTKYYKRLYLATLAYWGYYFINRDISMYYKTEVLALKIGKIFAEKK